MADTVLAEARGRARAAGRGRARDRADRGRRRRPVPNDRSRSCWRTGFEDGRSCRPRSSFAVWRVRERGGRRRSQTGGRGCCTGSSTPARSPVTRSRTGRCSSAAPAQGYRRVLVRSGDWLLGPGLRRTRRAIWPPSVLALLALAAAGQPRHLQLVGGFCAAGMPALPLGFGRGVRELLAHVDSVYRRDRPGRSFAASWDEVGIADLPPHRRGAVGYTGVRGYPRLIGENASGAGGPGNRRQRPRTPGSRSTATGSPPSTAGRAAR